MPARSSDCFLSCSTTRQSTPQRVARLPHPSCMLRVSPSLISEIQVSASAKRIYPISLSAFTGQTKPARESWEVQVWAFRSVGGSRKPTAESSKSKVSWVKAPHSEYDCQSQKHSAPACSQS